MPKNPARYSVTFGLSGCYLPDSHAGVFECATRKEFSRLIQDLLRQYELPKSLFADVRIIRLWAFIKRHGSSSAHFSLMHKGHSLSFHGLTEAEFKMESESED